MGLKSEIKVLVFNEYAPVCRKDGAVSYPGMVRISDVLNRLHHKKGPQFDNTFTGVQAYDLLMEAVTPWMMSHEAVLAIVADDQDYVPAQKHLEQSTRRRPLEDRIEKLIETQPDFTPYTNDCEFCDGGLVRPRRRDGVSDDDVRLEVDGNPFLAVEPFFLEEVLIKPKLRKKLMSYICHRMVRHLRVPPGKLIRFTYDGSIGSWWFDSTGARLMSLDQLGHGE